LHIREFQVDLEALQRLTEVAEIVAQFSGQENFEVPVEVNLDLAEGSLRVVVAVVGSLFSVYYFVGNYKAFKEGAVEICNDANKFGDDFCDKFLKKAGISKSKVSKQKVAVQTPARLLDVLNELEQLDDKQTADELKKHIFSEGSRTVRLARGASRLDRVLRDLSEAERSAVTSSLKFEALPPYTQWSREEQLPEPLRVASRPDETRLRLRDSIAERAPRAGPPKLRIKKKVFVVPKRKIGKSDD
jgi:hypothetical protein